MTEATLIKDIILLKLYRLWGSVHQYPGGKHAVVRQAWCWRSREFHALTVFWAASRRVSRPTPTVTDFLHQGHTSQ